MGPVAGAVADRLDRRRVLITAQAGAGIISAVLATLTGLGHVNAPLVIGLAFPRWSPARREAFRVLARRVLEAG